MSKWKDMAPTKMLGGGKATRKIGAEETVKVGAEKTVKVGAEETVKVGAEETVKIDAQQPAGAAGQNKRGVNDIPDVSSSPNVTDFRSEDGAMGGGNRYSEGDVVAPAAGTSSSPKTQFFRPNKNKQVESADEVVEETVQVVAKPITGWLVVVKGKGKGQAIPLSYGLLKVGRDASQDVPLNFGDNGISRENHASIEYDNRARKFYLYKGENLVYLNGERVGMDGKATATGDTIELTDDTSLRFVAFCGPEFDWNDE